MSSVHKVKTAAKIKVRKRGIQKGIPTNIPKKLRKIYQKASKIIPEWKEKSTIGHAPWKTTKVEKTIGLSNRKRGSGHAEKGKKQLKICAKSMPE